MMCDTIWYQKQVLAAEINGPKLIFHIKDWAVID